MTTSIPHARIKKILSLCRRRTVLVVGDAMLDEYLWGEVNRISPEAPVPVVEVQSTSLKLGGAANVACNLKALGLTPHLVALCGTDANGERLRGRLQAMDMPIDGLFSSPGRPTTLKTRILAQHQQVVRADHEIRDPITDKEFALLFHHIRSIIHDMDAVILSDYAKGVLAPRLVTAVITLCREHGVFVAVDPKTHDFSTYAGAGIVTPNWREALQAAKRPFEPCTVEQVQDLGWALVSRYELESLLITLGEHGMAVFVPRDRSMTHLHTAARKVFDVTGAGDTVISTYAAAVCCGAAPAEAAYLANMAAGMTVAELGTISVDRKALLARCLEERQPG